MQATGGVNGMMRRGETLLRMSDIGKSFSGVPVLSDVHFDLRSGEVHVLAGENGAGKSTLIKILAGAYGDYDGTIELSGEIVHFRSPHEATDRGIAVIYQEMSLVGSLSIVDNIFLGREPAAGGLWLDTKREIGMASELLQEVGVDVDMLQPVEEYPISIRQMIEIVKALAINASIIVMDEPTSSLNDVEVDRLFSIIGVLKARGCGIVYITHKMEEIYRIADRITVLRDGKCIGTSAASGLSQAELIRWMVGREINQQFPRRSVTPGALRLQVEHLSVRDPSDPSRYVVHDVSFAVRAGEILGVAGLQGSGNSELLNGLFGTYGALAGATVRIDDVPFHIRSPQDSIERGVALLTNDRKTSGLVMEMEVVHNLTLASLRKFSPGGWLLPAREERAARIRSDALNLKAASLWQEAGTLSGGNQQKVVLAKWLETSPRVFLLDEPTRGVDVGVKHEIYELMNRWTESGCAIVLLTSEMPELLAMADRVLVMHRGRVASEFSRNDATQENILRAAMGGTLERPA